MNTQSAPETYTVTKYDAAEQDGYRRSDPAYYWFDVKDNSDKTWLIMGAKHSDTSPANKNAHIDEVEFTRVPVESAKVLQLGTLVLQAAAKNFAANGAEKLLIEEPMISDVQQWNNAFGSEHLHFDPPVDTSSTEPDLYIETTMSVDLTGLNMDDWHVAHVHNQPTNKPAGYAIILPKSEAPLS